MVWMETVRTALFGHGGAHLHSVHAAAVNGTEAAVVPADVPELTLHEVNQATRSFSRARQIGRGHYTTMYRATLRSGRLAVAKSLHLPPSGTWDASDVAVFKHHLSVASRLRHENVVRLLGYSLAGGDLRVLLYEFAAMGTLHDVLHGARQPAGASHSRQPAPARLGWAQRLWIALDAARGLEYLHEVARPPVTHGEVRSTNVLLFEGFRARIDDNNMYNQAPEYAGIIVETDGRFTEKSDVFSFGVVLLELLTGRKSIDSMLPPDQYSYSLPEWVTPLLREDRVEDCIDLKLGAEYSPAGAFNLGRIVVQCLQQDPCSRLTVLQTRRFINASFQIAS